MTRRPLTCRSRRAAHRGKSSVQLAGELAQVRLERLSCSLVLRLDRLTLRQQLRTAVSSRAHPARRAGLASLRSDSNSLPPFLITSSRASAAVHARVFSFSLVLYTSISVDAAIAGPPRAPRRRTASPPARALTPHSVTHSRMLPTRDIKFFSQSLERFRAGRDVAMERRRVEVVGRRERMRVPRADRGERAAAAAARVTATAAAAAADPGKRAMILKDLQARRALLMAARGPLAAFSEADLLTAPAIGRELALACSRGVPEPGGGDGLWGRVARVPGAPAFAAYAALRDAALRRRDEGRAATRALPAIDAEVEALQSAEAGAPEAEQAAFPPLIAGGVAAVYAYLASAAAVDPAACMEPFRILAGIVGALDVQAALREPAPLVANLAAMFRRNSLPPGVCGAPAAAAELAALSASSLVALALARGTAGAVLEAAHALVALVDGGSSLLFPVPRALQVRRRLPPRARGRGGGVTRWLP